MPTDNSVPFIGIPTEEQLKNFFAFVGYDEITGCHPWTGAKGFHPDYPGDLTQAQGRWNYNGRTVTAYRFAMYIELAYEQPGPTVDHQCHNRICVNPLHLRCMPQIENNRLRRCILSDYCKHGHLRTLESVGINSTTGNRFCRICTRIADKKRHADKYQKEKLKNTHSSEMRDFARDPKLNEDKVWQILYTYWFGGENISTYQLGYHYQVSAPMIRNIIKGKSWKKVYDKFVDQYPDVLVDGTL